MATSSQLKALVQSHADGDDSQFYAVAMQVAAKAARAGNSKVAQELRDLVNASRAHSPKASPVADVLPIGQPKGELGELLRVVHPDAKISDLVLSESIAESLTDLVREHRQSDVLERYGLTPSRRVLLSGPPGTGKTSAARVIASELGLPLFVVRLDSVLSKYMGETAAKLRLVFDAVAQVRGVYLFDEVDALGSERSASNDVGEIRRVLNSFLQFLEEDVSESVVVAATNHLQLLDEALFRRFEQIIDFELPDDDAIVEVIRNYIPAVNLSGVNWSDVCASARGLNHAEIAVAAQVAAKRAVLAGRDQVSTRELVAAACGRAPRTNA
jgi:SpoVK/Ycf46/Vps4 family AAA+-type ATPase